MLTGFVRRAHAEEHGSIVVAMLVLMVLTLLVTGVLARSVGNQHSVSRDQQYDAALATADGGMSDAYFRIVNGATTTFTESSTLGGGTYTYTATKVSDSEWTVVAHGTVNGVQHSIQATVEAGVLYPFALFTNQAIDINGLGTGCCSSYNSSTGATNTGHAWLGSNGNISCHGTNGDAQVVYSPSGGESGCSNPMYEPGPYVLADPVLPASTQPCPTNGTFPSLINGQGGRTFNCSDVGIEFSSGDTMVTNGPVIIYVSGTGSVNLSDASINQTGSAANFRILVNGPLDVDLGTGSHGGAMRGVLYAPQSDLTADGCKYSPDGSVVVNSYICNGAPGHMDVKYDELLMAVTGAWNTVDWHEVAS